MQTDIDAVRTAVEKTVRARMVEEFIVRVDVKPGEDFEGDPVIFVSVVFEGEVESLDFERLSGLTRHLRSKLPDIGEDRFPHTRFVSKSEFEGHAAFIPSIS